jgi:glycosyltransferase involved in cell wall biosynthesis
VNGILVEDQNMQSMSEELNRLIENPEKRLEFAKRGVESLDKFKIEEIYQKYLDLFEAIKDEK